MRAAGVLAKGRMFDMPAVEHPGFTADFNDLMFVRELFHFTVGELLSVRADSWPAG